MEDAPEPIISLIAEIPENYQKRVELTEEARGLAQHYIDENALSKNHLVDAQHIAIATLCKVDLVVSWNFKHIVHFVTYRIDSGESLELNPGIPAVKVKDS